MKKTIFAVATFLMFSAAFAQTKQNAEPAKMEPAKMEKQHNGKKNPHTPEQKAKKRAEKISKELGCDAKQTEKIYSLLLEKQGKVSAIRNGKKELTKEEKEKVREINKTYKGELKSILTPEQFKKWEEIRKPSPERQKAIDNNPNMDERKKEPSDLD